LTIFVLDASTALAWAIDDERQPQAMQVLAGLRAKNKARVPAVWWFEMRNPLVINERRGRLTETDTADFLRGLNRLPVGIDRSPIESALLALARRHRMTVYDAAYLELAQREGLPLASFDGPLRAVAAPSGVPLLGA